MEPGASQTEVATRINRVLLSFAVDLLIGPTLSTSPAISQPTLDLFFCATFRHQSQERATPLSAAFFDAETSCVYPRMSSAGHPPSNPHALCSFWTKLGE